MSRTLTAVAVVGALIALPVACSAYSTWSTVTSAPARVVNKTLQTNNIIMNYELFHDEAQQFTVKLAQIRDHERFLAVEHDPEERSRLRMELAAQQQSCRELAADFNANSAKLNRAVFRDRGLPSELDATLCETREGAPQ